MGKFPQFFQNNNGRYSMAKLLLFLSFFPSAVVVLYTMNWETLTPFLTAYTGAAIGNMMSKEKNVKPIDGE